MIRLQTTDIVYRLYDFSGYGSDDRQVESFKDIEPFGAKGGSPISMPIDELLRSAFTPDWRSSDGYIQGPGKPRTDSAIRRLVDDELRVRKALDQLTINTDKPLLGSGRPVIEAGCIQADLQAATRLWASSDKPSTSKCLAMTALSSNGRTASARRCFEIG